ncbi:origin recognition complex, subunit 2 [Mycena pura]|uniref:Origin recognition complex subunit 2 n=1 Tax=Mycena pura TaxID=153505 RepID=A0AAD6VE51_9AGAR|nr:origin recognition complex, subunit 2 [Mycena pura]
MAVSDASDTDASSDFSDVEAVLHARGKGKGKAKAAVADADADAEEDSRRAIVQTSFDAFFKLSAAKAATSSNIFSALVQPLSMEEYIEAIAQEAPGEKRLESLILREPARSALFAQLLCELNEGFNVVCYGFGSKRSILNEFATSQCAKKGHVVVVNGFHPELSLKDMLNSIEDNIQGVVALPLSANTPDGQARRIYDYFWQPKRRDLYLVIHNIDAFLLRTPKAKTYLSLLALHPRIHLVASVDHLNAPLLWSAAEGAARKSTGGGGGANGTAPARGFAWLWHDVTTLAPYDAELASADRTSITGAHARRQRELGGVPAGGAGAALSDTAVRHVLAAVTDRAQKLFVLMGRRQLASIDTDDPPVDALQPHAVPYEVLFPLAQREFISTGDTQLRAQLGEFRDHGLVVSAQAGVGGEVLWIPIRKERLVRILALLDKS